MVEYGGGTRTGKRVDPYAAFKFHVEIGEITEAAFSECSGLDVSTRVFEYEEGGLNEYTLKFPGTTKHSNITLKRGFALSNELYKWFSEMEECLLKGEPVVFRKVTITLHSAVNEEPMVWTLNDAFPVKWVGPVVKVDSTEVAVETLEFTHHGLRLG